MMILIIVILSNCQLNKTQNNHGIIFLKNRYEKLIVNKTNSNDVVNILGQPHTKSIKNNNDWIYIERVLKKGSFHKMGKNVVKENNVVVLSFNKFGILENKVFFDKKKLANIDFSNEKTFNSLKGNSFVSDFLQSIRAKMYGNR